MEQPPKCTACGSTALHIGRSGTLECGNCGIEMGSLFEYLFQRSELSETRCRWCEDGTTMRVSTVRRSAGGAWEVHRCSSCAATFANYLPTG